MVPELHLFMAAFVLGIIAIIVLFTLRWWTLAAGPRDRLEVQRDVIVNVPQEFAAAEAAGREARRARVARQERVRGILTAVVFGLSGVTVIIALAAFFWAADREAVAVCAMIATVTSAFATVSYSSARREAKGDSFVAAGGPVAE